jgi:riboflavin kinase / FMN adenylyltransferase
VLTLQLGEPLPDMRGSLPAVAAIGNFDGVHLGHRLVLQQVVAAARRAGRASLAITFWPNPRAVLRPEHWQGYLTTEAERTALLAALGIDAQLCLPFTEAFSKRSPEEFVDQLATAIPLAELWVGEDFRFGHRRSGDVALLRTLAEPHGMTIRLIARQGAATGAISSSAIRNQVRAGQVEEAAGLLGRPYRLGGSVVTGDRRGRQLGFPTANLAPDEGKIIPGRGIYAAVAHFDGVVRPAAVSVGVRPQFDGLGELVEAFLLDFSGDLYGRRLDLDFLAKLRDEARFESVEALVAQMERDVARVREMSVTADEPGAAGTPDTAAADRRRRALAPARSG